MQFHLNFNPTVSADKINHQQQLLFIGSCFSEHISQKLQQLKYKVRTNPFGIIFNPISIAKSLTRIVNLTEFTKDDIIEYNEHMISLEAHSAISASDKTELVTTLNTTLINWHQYLKNADYLYITFGSAYGYQYLESGEIVANCHKLPASKFKKTLLQPHDLIKEYQVLIDTLKAFNPSLKIVFTVSPVKHLRDGIIENNLSKSILTYLTHSLLTKKNPCYYFPAYELVIDDLRDYRFYEADMAHPNKQAVNYVWQKFTDIYFNEDTKKLNEQLQNISKAMLHKPFNTNTDSFKKFKQEYYKRCKDIQTEQQHLDFSAELQYFTT